MNIKRSMETKDTKNAYVRQVAEQKYEYGFTTDVHTDIIEKGLNEDVVRLISSKKGEPDWMLEFRLQAFRHWQTMKEPKWGHVHVPEIDYQAISYYADPLAKKKNEKKDENKKEHYLRREFSYTKFQQSLYLPDNVDKEKITANVANGVLTIELPKYSQEEKAKINRVIEIH